MLQLLLLFLPISFLLGWFVGYYSARQQGDASSGGKQHLSPEYFWGLNYLVNEHTDKAIDVLIKLVEVNQDTIELHLALGKLFRKRGELDRALRVHQHLEQHQQLPPLLRAQVELELARDYFSAGVLDRAENLLRTLVKRKELVEDSLHELIHLHQQQHAWKKMLAAAEYLMRWSGQDSRKILAYGYCELAEQRLNGVDDDGMIVSYAKQAVIHYPGGARGYWILAKYYLAHRQYRRAWESLRQLIIQNELFAVEMMPLLVECYPHLADGQQQMVQLLKKSGLSISCSPEGMDMMVEQYGAKKILVDLFDKLAGDNLPLILLRIINLHLKYRLPVESWELMQLCSRLELFYNKLRQNYSCQQCGFISSMLFWQCPNCQSWDGLVPLVRQ